MSKKPTYEELEHRIQELEQAEFERKRSDEALRKRESQYRILAENISDVVWTMDLSQRFTYFSPSIQKFRGYTPEEALQIPIEKSLTPESYAKAASILMEEFALEGEPGVLPDRSQIIELEHIRKDGSTVWGELTASFIRDKGGLPCGIIGITRDITERKQAENELLLNQNRLKAISEIGVSATSTLDLKAVLEVILKGTLETVKASAGMIFLKDPVSGYLSWGASSGLSKAFINEFQNRTIQPGEGLTGRIAQDGKPIYIPVNSSQDPRIVRPVIEAEGLNSFIGVPIYAADKIIAVMNVLTHPPAILSKNDIYLCMAIGSQTGLAIRNAQFFAKQKRTEAALRESEEKYRSIMEAMEDAAFICSHDFKIEYMNPSMHRMIGYDATSESCHQAIYGLDEKCSWCRHATVIEGESIKNEITSPKDGKIYLISSSPVFHTNGSISNLTIFHDITDIRKTEAQLQQAQKMESVGRLAGGVAHDYNNELSVIMGFTEMAINNVDPADSMRANLEEVLKAANRSAVITRQLLAFARKQTIAPKLLSLNDTVEGMLKMLRRLIGEDIELIWSPGTGLWTIKMDPNQIDQILANLCVNARDAIDGVGKITIETKNVSFDEDDCAYNPDFVPGAFVLLSVTDNGCGMDKETLDNIFEPFFTTKDVDKGTGLGMSTVYGITKQNKGLLSVSSEPGNGTTIRIYLPHHEEKVYKNQTESTIKIPQGNGETLLVVEDDLSVLRLTAKILDELGYTVLTSGTTKGAMKTAWEYEGKIHLLITDVIMPEMNGRELAMRLQTLYPDLKFIFMSGYTANVIAHHGVLDDNVHFIQKPFSKRDLAIIVRKTMDD